MESRHDVQYSMQELFSNFDDFDCPMDANGRSNKRNVHAVGQAHKPDLSFGTYRMWICVQMGAFICATHNVVVVAVIAVDESDIWPRSAFE